MKVALLIQGLAYGKNHKGFQIEPLIGFGYNKKCMMGDNVDVFLHSWNPEHKTELEEMYRPVKSYHSTQKKYPNANQPKEHAKFSFFDAFRICTELMEQYEIENNFKYDIVAKTRYKQSVS